MYLDRDMWPKYKNHMQFQHKELVFRFFTKVRLNCTLRQYSHLKQRPADDDKLEHLSYLSRIYNKMGTRS